MKPTLRAFSIVLPILLVLPVALQAGPVTIPPADTSGPGPNDLNAFEAGKPAKAAEVMHNFKVLAEAVNTAVTDVSALKASLDSLQVEIDQLRTAFLAKSGGPRNVRVFYSSGTWEKPDGATRVWVRLVGGGGGGGGGGWTSSTSFYGAGGGGADTQRS